MIISKAGALIRSGKTTEEIREKIEDFPEKPDIQYFIELGYTKSTAKNYINRIKTNGAQKQEIAEKVVQTVEQDKELIVSPKADFKNIILDTCALQNETTVKIIEDAKKVTVLLAVLNEMDNLKYSLHRKKEENKIQKREEYIFNKINIYARKCLLETNKYRLVPFDMKEERYTDNKILQYLLLLPLEERPTLLTADYLLSARAKCLGLEYILYIAQNKPNDVIKIESEEKKEKSSVKNKQKISNKKIHSKLGIGIEICKNNKIIVSKYNQYAKILVIDETKCFEVEKRATINKVEYFAIIAKNKATGGIKLQKIEIADNEKEIKEYEECKYINDIYKLEEEVHSNVLECMKKLLLS